MTDIVTLAARAILPGTSATKAGTRRRTRPYPA